MYEGVSGVLPARCPPQSSHDCPTKNTAGTKACTPTHTGTNINFDIAQLKPDSYGVPDPCGTLDVDSSWKPQPYFVSSCSLRVWVEGNSTIFAQMKAAFRRATSGQHEYCIGYGYTELHRLVY